MGKLEGNADYCEVPIHYIKKYGDRFPFDLFLKLSDEKVVRISNKDGPVAELVEKYLSKGVQAVYANKVDFAIFINQVRQDLTKKFFDPSVSTEDKVQDLSAGHSIVKESFKKLGLTEHSAELAKEVASRSLQLISQQPNIFEFFRNFREKCSTEYVNNMLTCYTAVCILDTFDWSSDSIKDKMSMAVMLRDVLLNQSDFDDVRAYERGERELAPHQAGYAHPNTTADMLESDKNTWIPKEVATIVRQHHEKMDSSGFPLGLGHMKITVLSAILIVADKFMEMMIANQFDLKKKSEIMATLGHMYNQGNFKKAYVGLQMMLNE